MYDEASGATLWQAVASEVITDILRDICTDALSDVRTSLLLVVPAAAVLCCCCVYGPAVVAFVHSGPLVSDSCPGTDRRRDAATESGTVEARSCRGSHVGH